MLKNLNKHYHKNPILISLVTITLIFTIIVLPIVFNSKPKDSSETKKFLETIGANSQISSVISQSSSNISISSLPESSSVSSSLIVNSSLTASSKTEIQPKQIDEVKPVTSKPIDPIPVKNIEPQNNIEKINVATPPKIQEIPKPIIQSAPEPKPIIAPAPVVNIPRPTTDYSYTATGCDQSLTNQMLAFVNNHRTANGSKALSFSNQLSGIACAHSKWMTTSGIFSHTGRDDTTPFERCKKAGTYCYAENVAYNTLPNVQDLFDQFKNSPGHNLNMLDSNFVEIGIAFDGIYVTQVFR